MRIYLSAPIVSVGDIALFDKVGVKNRLKAFPILDLMENDKKLDIPAIIKACRQVKGTGECLMYDSGVSSLNVKFFKNTRTLLKDRNQGYVFSTEKFRKIVDMYCETVGALDAAGVMDCVLEMDVDHFMGMEEVLKIREKLLKVTTKLVPVWRASQGEKEFDRVTREYKYVAFSLIRSKAKEEGWGNLLFEAYRRGVKTHLFAFIRPEYLTRFPCYSTDSSSWTKGRRWGIVAYRSERTSMTVGGRPAADGARAFRDSSFLGLSKSDKFNPFEKNWVLEAAVRDYVKLEEKITEVWARRGYVYAD